MDDSLILGYLVNLVGPLGMLVVSVLGSLVVLGGVVVGMTPSLEDDAWLAKVEASPLLGGVYKALASFSPIHKKPKA